MEIIDAVELTGSDTINNYQLWPPSPKVRTLAFSYLTSISLKKWTGPHKIFASTSTNSFNVS